MIALGMASLQAASAPTLAPQENASKPWSVSASLRGFYDDNYATAPSGPLRRDSFGFEVSPMASVSLIGDQTQFSAAYKFGLRYYEDRVNNEFDYSHKFTARLDHAFSERLKMTLWDELVIAQEPFLLNPGLVVQTMRVNGNNLRNTAGLDFEAKLTDHITLEPGYNFSLYDYRAKGPSSYSALLDRYDHLFKLGVRWVNMLERTDGILGYQFNYVDHSSKDTLDPSGATMVSPSLRDTKSHFLFAGADYNASEKLTLSGRAGVQLVDYSGTQDNKANPYFDLSASYRFLEASSLQVGYKLQRMTTDTIGFSAAAPTNLTVDQLAHFVYGRVSHKVGDLTLSGGVLYQFGTFRGGLLHGQDEAYLSADINASYRINPYLSAEAGYVFDWLNDSDWASAGVPARDYHRNFVYLGLKATY